MGSETPAGDGDVALLGQVTEYGNGAEQIFAMRACGTLLGDRPDDTEVVRPIIAGISVGDSVECYGLAGELNPVALSPIEVYNHVVPDAIGPVAMGISTPPGDALSVDRPVGVEVLLRDVPLRIRLKFEAKCVGDGAGIDGVVARASDEEVIARAAALRSTLSALPVISGRTRFTSRP